MSSVPPSLSATQVPRSGIRAMFDAAAQIPDVISLAVGEPSETAELHVVAAAERAIRDGRTHYTDVLGIPEFRQAATRYTRQVRGLSYNPESEVQAVPGATLGLYLALRAILNPGDEVIVPSPAFASYDAQIALAGGKAVHVPVHPENGMRVDARDIARAVTDRTRALILNSPSNPTGAITPADELIHIAHICEAENLWAISDDVYHAFIYGDDTRHRTIAPSIAAVPGMRERTIIVDSLSKTFAMTGWRIGYLLGPATLIEHTAAIAEQIHSSISAPSQYAAVAALTGPLDGVTARHARYARQRELLLDTLQGAEALTAIPPEGAFYAFVDVRGTGLSSAEFSHRLLHEHHVAVVPGEAFGHAGEGFVRVSFVGAEAGLREALKRMVRFACRPTEQISRRPHRAAHIASLPPQRILASPPPHS